MFRKLNVAIVLMILCSSAHAQEKSQKGDSGIIYGENHAFTLTAPKGWVLDNTSGRTQGLQAVFYPEGSSWQKGAVVMYANVYQKKDIKKESLETVIAGDVAEYKNRSAELSVTDAEPLTTTKDKRVKGKKATIKYFTGDAHGNDEAVAYIDEGKVVVMLVLSARNKKDFESSLPAFKELVGSYFFLGNKVTFHK
jgi:hypothetical protein